MKLELKHLSAYLPYNLKVIYKVNKPRKLMALDAFTNEVYSENDIFLQDAKKISEIKPILRPLSDLQKEITINGENIIPIIELAKIEFRHSNIKEIIPYEDSLSVLIVSLNDFRIRMIYSEKNKTFQYSNQINTNICTENYELIEKLKEWHFDIFGLIKGGVAIDKNSL